jgi:hypothetical protein
MENFNKMLSTGIKDSKGNTIDMSYMAQDIIHKIIKPYDFGGFSPKQLVERNIKYMDLNVKKNNL